MMSMATTRFPCGIWSAPLGQPPRPARWAYSRWTAPRHAGRFFSLYGSYAQYWTKINPDIAFHSVIYNEVDYNALNRKSYNMLGSRASHGCIRLLNHDALWIYENVGEGTKVTITEDLPLDQELRAALKPNQLSSSWNSAPVTPEPTTPPVLRERSVATPAVSHPEKEFNGRGCILAADEA